MTATVQALYRYFGGFGLPVYAEGDAPATATPPYITVQIIEPRWDESTPIYARVWYRGSSYQPILDKVDEIGADIGAGVGVPTGGGALYISKGAHFAQVMPMEGDPALKCVYLNMNIHAIAR